MIGVAVSLATLAFTTAHAAILVQFIGTSDNVLMWLTLIQAVSLIFAVITLTVAAKWFKSSVHAHADSELWRSEMSVSANLGRWWERLPGWLIFLCLLLIATVFLGEISILIARIQGDNLSWFHHAPTVTVISVCAVLCVAWLLRY